MRNWKYEQIKLKRGTPSKKALSPYKIMNHTIEHVPNNYFLLLIGSQYALVLAVMGLMDYTIISLTKLLHMTGLTVFVKTITTLQRFMENTNFLANRTIVVAGLGPLSLMRKIMTVTVVVRIFD